MASGDSNILWRATSGTRYEAPGLAADVTADAVIVGGGFTGLSAALHLAQKGIDVRLLEAQSIGYGGSGRNVGLVNAGLWTPPDGVEEALGVIAGTKLNELLAAGPDLVFSLIATHGIECEAARNGTLHCADSAEGLRDLETRFNQQKKRGAPVELLNAALAEKRLGSGRFQAALLDRRAGTIQPLAYARGLARAAASAGAVLHENTTVTAMRRDGEDWRVTTADGAVTARWLIVATNAYAIRAARRHSSFTPVHFFQLATEPLKPEMRQMILAGGEGCWDTAKVMTSFRVDGEGRLILGSVGSLKGFGSKWNRAWARRKLRWIFPGLGNMRFEHVWHGRIAMTSDHMPKIADLGPTAISIFGFNGRGIAPGTVFGKCAAEWIISEDPGRLPIAPTQMVGEGFTSLKRKWYEFGAAASHLVGNRRSRS